MLGKFFGRDKETRDFSDNAWPLKDIVATLEQHYGDAVDKIGADGPLIVYGVADKGVNFVVALVQTGPGTGRIVELGFLARFVGFPVDLELIQSINRNLHLAVASLEGDDLFLMAGVQITGPYDQTQFMLLLESWRRDLAATIGGLTRDQAAYADMFPAAKMEAARRFATNVAPENDRRAAGDLLQSFLGAPKATPKIICDECDGRGKRGLIARICGECGGVGFR